MHFSAGRYQLLTATVAATAALTLGAAGAANAAPLELETAPVAVETAPSGTDDIALGSGSASLSADPGSAQALVSGSAGSGSGAGSSNPYWPYTGSGTPSSGSAQFGDRISKLGPNLANGIDSLMRTLGFRPGNVPGCPEAGQAAQLRGAPGYNPLQDSEISEIACG